MKDWSITSPMSCCNALQAKQNPNVIHVSNGGEGDATKEVDECCGQREALVTMLLTWQQSWQGV